MSKLLQIISIALFLLFVIIGRQWCIDKNKLDLYRKIHYMDSLNSERKDKLIQRQDSLIEYLYEIKVTKITIIEKDTIK